MLFVPDLMAYWLSRRAGLRGDRGEHVAALGPRGPRLGLARDRRRGAAAPALRPARADRAPSWGRCSRTWHGDAGARVPVCPSPPWPRTTPPRPWPPCRRNRRGLRLRLERHVVARGRRAARRPCARPRRSRTTSPTSGAWRAGARFLRNVMGLWLVQECRRTWAREGDERSYGELVALAGAGAGRRPARGPGHPSSSPPGDMPAPDPARVRSGRASRRRTHTRRGRALRAGEPGLQYRWVLERVEEASGRRYSRPSTSWAGRSRNARALPAHGRPRGPAVLAGPVEATALGNVLVQAQARGRVGSLEEIRAVVRASTRLRTYEPGDPREETWSRFERVLGAS